MENKKSARGKNIKLSTVVISFAIVAFVFVAVFVVMGYGNGVGPKGSLSWIFSKTVSYPIALVDWTNGVSMDEFQKNIETMRIFYSNSGFTNSGMRVDFSTPEGEKRLKVKEKTLLNRMIENKVVELLAKREGVEVSDDEVSRSVKKKLDEYGTKDDVEKDLKEKYGWTLDDFKQKVVKPAMLDEALAKKVLTDDFSKKEAQEKINEAQAEVKSGQDFAKVAEKYSEGSSAGQGGEIGWIKKTQAIPELQEVLFSKQGPEKNKIYESALGFHVLEVMDRKNEGADEVVRVRQIFVRKKYFADWLDQEIRKMRIWIPVKGFYWDKQNAGVQFSDKDMQEFEKQVLENPNGDASLIF